MLTTAVLQRGGGAGCRRQVDPGSSLAGHGSQNSKTQFVKDAISGDKVEGLGKMAPRGGGDFPGKPDSLALIPGRHDREKEPTPGSYPLASHAHTPWYTSPLPTTNK